MFVEFGRTQDVEFPGQSRRSRDEGQASSTSLATPSRLQLFRPCVASDPPSLTSPTHPSFFSPPSSSPSSHVIRPWLGSLYSFSDYSKVMYKLQLVSCLVYLGFHLIFRLVSTLPHLFLAPCKNVFFYFIFLLVPSDFLFYFLSIIR